MCGIGAVFAREPLQNIKKIIALMAEKLRHRGPDYQGIFVDQDLRVGLSHARLSIVDLSPQGNQPIPNETEDFWLVCNGEIYNHGEIRKKLQARGHSFRSRSDSEVILHLYEEYGTDLLQYLHGMYAFVLYDSVKKVLFCARDRLGKKPFVYSQNREGVAIASEIPAVRCFPDVDTSVDPVALGLYLLRNVRHIPDPWTFFKGIHRLMPGHAMIVENGAVKKIWRYWHPDFEQQETTPEKLREAFDRAVSTRMVADVDVGALLSGGVDSSGIVQAMVSQGAKRIKTYAMGLNKDDEELSRARQMAGLLGTDHKEYYFEPDRQFNQLETILKIYGEPIMLMPLLYTLELCEHIRDDGIKVVLSGHGADELYYGYSGHNPLALVSTLLPFVPGILKPYIGGLAGRLTPGSRVKEAFLIASSPVGERKAALYKSEAKTLWAELLNISDMDQKIEDTVSKWLGVWFEEDKPYKYIDEANVIGLMHENTHSVTIAGDLPAMAASVEMRAPFLDQDIVQLAWRTPYRYKIKSIFDKSQNKWILKKALEGRVPQELLYAAKRGFGYYIREEDVLRGPWKARLDEAFNSLDDLGGVLKLAAFRKLKDRFDKNHGVPAMLIAKLFAIHLLEIK